MEYTVSQLGKLSGVSARTLHYYDQIDLLKPSRINSSGYRIYGQVEVDLLQQILFYRELDMALEDIKEIVQADDFDSQAALESHLVHLSHQRNRLDRMILTVEKTIQAREGGTEMSEQEKFDAFKQEWINENEEKYGAEIRTKYGEDVISQTNKKLKGITETDWKNQEELTKRLNEKLAEATKMGDPASELAQEVAALHKEWLIFSWPEGLYDAEKHFNLSLMYVEDSAFEKYYEDIAPGAADFLHAALKIYLNK